MCVCRAMLVGRMKNATHCSSNSCRFHTEQNFDAALNDFLHALRQSFKGAKAAPARKYHAETLLQAGICVRVCQFQRTIHDFVMLNALAHITARGVIALATA